MMKKKNITIDDLAVMVQKGFGEVAKKDEVDSQFQGVNKRFDIVEERLDRIERIVLDDHRRRIEHLEDTVKHIIDTFAIK